MSLQAAETRGDYPTEERGGTTAPGAGLSVGGLTKRYGRTAAVDGIDLQVRSGEFLAVLGPSGCGKTTLLRLIAGFERSDAGTIRLGDRAFSGPGFHLPAERRQIGIVFQSYALWPHMSVAENVGYPLRVAGAAEVDRRRGVEEALATVGLDGYGARRPAELSGGQRQRVALARCLVMRPSLVLLDEPLANLDVHLRASMQEEFARLHKATGATMVYVTHDQAEAMALAERIAVLDRGKLVQLDPPRTLYREPANAMVAGFVGEGTLLRARAAGPVEQGRLPVQLLGRTVPLRCARAAEGEVLVSLRPEDLIPDPSGIPATVVRNRYRGAVCEVDAAPAAAPDLRLRLVLPDPAPAPGQTLHLSIRDGWVVPGG